MPSIENTEDKDLIKNLILLVEEIKLQAVSYANSSLTILSWYIGNRILHGELKNQRAEYGKQIVVMLS